MKDHLGNTRVSFDESGTLVQALAYYPFGMTMTSDGNQNNLYRYNGKELQEGTDWYDYGARFYDPQLGRWHSVDPLAESYVSQSPYHFSGNNPIKFVDLNGMNYTPIYDEETSEFLLNFVNGNSRSRFTTYALGRTRMTLQSKALGGIVTVSNGAWNAYDWDYGGNLLRETLIFGERTLKGLNDSHGFPIQVYGTGLFFKKCTR